jgi:hypothetical protein
MQGQEQALARLRAEIDKVAHQIKVCHVGMLVLDNVAVAKQLFNGELYVVVSLKCTAEVSFPAVMHAVDRVYVQPLSDL